MLVAILPPMVPSPMNPTTTSLATSISPVVLLAFLLAFLERYFQRQHGMEGDADLANQRGAIDVGLAGRVGPGKAAGHLATAEDQDQPRRFRVLVHNHLATPLAAAERI